MKMMRRAGFILFALIVVQVSAAPAPQSFTESFTQAIRRGFMSMISLPSQTLNTLFSNNGGGGGLPTTQPPPTQSSSSQFGRGAESLVELS